MDDDLIEGCFFLTGPKLREKKVKLLQHPPHVNPKYGSASVQNPSIALTKPQKGSTPGQLCQHGNSLLSGKHSLSQTKIK